MHVDKVGDLSLLENTLVYKQTKQTYVHHHFIQEYTEYGTVKVQFVCSEENITEIFTKNLSNGTFESITTRYVHRE